MECCDIYLIIALHLLVLPYNDDEPNFTRHTRLLIGYFLTFKSEQRAGLHGRLLLQLVQSCESPFLLLSLSSIETFTHDMSF